MVKKVTISLPDALLAAIDAEAETRGVSRSLVVQEASAHYAAHSAEQRADEARRAKALAAVARMRDIAAMPLTGDTRSSADVLREIRAGDDERAARP